MFLLYQTTNLVNGKFYIGVHNGANAHYLGSGTILKRAIKKHGKHNFCRVVLAECETETFVYKLESVVVDQAFVNRPDTYNTTVGGSKPPDWTGVTRGPFSPEHRQKLSKTHKRLGLLPPSRRGCSPTLEDRQKKSLALKGRPWSVARRTASEPLDSDRRKNAFR